jgi:transcription elongation GreA/GreB family factor
MSRAFVKDQDDAVEDLPERPVSTAPNLVTAEGLAAIEAEIAALNDALTKAGDDRAERNRIGRDLRYWVARRGSAQLMPPPADSDTVHFGSTVALNRDDGRHQVFRIVGEDEAAPESGTLSHVSPLARELLGKSEGDTVRVAGHGLEIATIS